MKCLNCQNEASEEFQFCPMCGFFAVEVGTHGTVVSRHSFQKKDPDKKVIQVDLFPILDDVAVPPAAKVPELPLEPRKEALFRDSLAWQAPRKKISKARQPDSLIMTIIFFNLLLLGFGGYQLLDRFQREAKIFSYERLAGAMPIPLSYFEPPDLNLFSALNAEEKAETTQLRDEIEKEREDKTAEKELASKKEKADPETALKTPAQNPPGSRWRGSPQTNAKKNRPDESRLTTFIPNLSPAKTPQKSKVVDIPPRKSNLKEDYQPVDKLPNLSPPRKKQPLTKKKHSETAFEKRNRLIDRYLKELEEDN